MATPIQMADFWSERNTLPVAGGVLDQTGSFLSFVRELATEEAKVKKTDG